MKSSSVSKSMKIIELQEELRETRERLRQAVDLLRESSHAIRESQRAAERTLLLWVDSETKKRALMIDFEESERHRIFANFTANSDFINEGINTSVNHVCVALSRMMFDSLEVQEIHERRQLEDEMEESTTSLAHSMERLQVSTAIVASLRSELHQLRTEARVERFRLTQKSERAAAAERTATAHLLHRANRWFETMAEEYSHHLLATSHEAQSAFNVLWRRASAEIEQDSHRTATRWLNCLEQLAQSFSADVPVAGVVPSATFAADVAIPVSPEMSVVRRGNGRPPGSASSRVTTALEKLLLMSPT